MFSLLADWHCTLVIQIYRVLDCAIFKMEVDCTLLLPEEVLELVFLQRVLSVSDLFRVAGTCRRFRVVVDRLWSKIARKR